MCDLCVTRCQSQHQKTLLANELDVQRVSHQQVSLAAVNHICIIHEAVNACKKYYGAMIQYIVHYRLIQM